MKKSTIITLAILGLIPVSMVAKKAEKKKMEKKSSSRPDTDYAVYLDLKIRDAEKYFTILVNDKAVAIESPEIMTVSNEEAKELAASNRSGYLIASKPVFIGSTKSGPIKVSITYNKEHFTKEPRIINDPKYQIKDIKTADNTIAITIPQNMSHRSIVLTQPLDNEDTFDLGILA